MYACPTIVIVLFFCRLVFKKISHNLLKKPNGTKINYSKSLYSLYITYVQRFFDLGKKAERYELN